MPREALEKIVFRHLGVNRKEVVLGPAFGEDGAVIEIGDKAIISSVDPITGAVERVGWLAINICANDVATFGVKPAYFSSCILLPGKADIKILEKICSQMDEAAEKLEIAVIGGHSELTLGLNHPIVVGFCIGITEKGKYVVSGGAKAGNHLILTKGAGIEGTAILATDAYETLKQAVDNQILALAQKFFEKISVVKDALTAFKCGGVNAMHDPTEGGVAGGIHEICDASNIGVKVYEEKVPVAEETAQICKFFKIDPLQLISSGALLVAAEKDKSQEIVKKLKTDGIKAEIIGEFTKEEKRRMLIRKDGRIEALPRPECDHLWVALEKSGVI